MSADIAGQAPTTYRFSCLFKALGVMWRSSGPALLFIVINTLIQAVLTWFDAQSGFTITFLLAFIVSALSALALYAVLAASALAAVDHSGGSVLGRARANFGRFTGWALLQWLLILIAALLQPALVLLVAAATPFLPVAAMDGGSNPLGANFRTLGRKFGRWLITSVILIVAGLVMFLLSAVNTFFIKGTPAAIFFWFFIGLVAWWTLTAWTLVYRAAQAQDAQSGSSAQE